MDPKVALESAIRISLYKHRGDMAMVATNLNINIKDVELLCCQFNYGIVCCWLSAKGRLPVRGFT